MSNPDEDTAIAQFGNDDKYFGVCVLMVTMPGLPMFAHGQIEGLKERYGMEFDKPRWQEEEDKRLIERHRREIFPLLSRRPLFSDVKYFLIYDFLLENGTSNENVFVFSNQYKTERSLVIFHNKYEEIKGWIRSAKRPVHAQGMLKWEDISFSEALGFTGKQDHYVIFKDQISNLEYIRNSEELKQNGLFKELGAFKYSVFLNFREVKDENGLYSELAEYLQGGGAEQIDRSLNKIRYKEMIQDFSELFSPQILNKFIELKKDSSELSINRFLAETEIRLLNVIKSLYKEFYPERVDDDQVKVILNDLKHWFFDEKGELEINNLIDLLLLSWIIVSGLIQSKKNIEIETDRNWIKQLFWAEIIADSLLEMNYHLPAVLVEAILISLIINQDLWQKLDSKNHKTILTNLIKEINTRTVLKINKYHDILWFDNDMFEILITLLRLVNINNLKSNTEIDPKNEFLQKFNLFIEKIRKAKQFSEFQVQKLISNME